MAKHKHSGDHAVLSKTESVRNRNAGPTSSLCSKSQLKRNELIHELVDFASFGDIKGIYIIYIYIYIYIYTSTRKL